MPASLRDVRVVSLAVNLPGLQFTAVSDVAREALKLVGLSVDDIGLLTVNEAVAGVPLIVQASPASRTTTSTSTAAPPPSGTRSAQPARMPTDLPRELERSQSRYGLQAICGTASAAVIELQ